MIDLEKMRLATALDTEGSIGIYIPKSFRGKFYPEGKDTGPIVIPTVTISNTNLEWIEYLKHVCGYGNITTQKGTNKKVYYLRFTHRQALKFLKIIFKYLIIKKYRAECIINYYQFIDSHPKLRARRRHPDRKKRTNMWNEFIKTPNGQKAVAILYK